MWPVERVQLYSRYQLPKCAWFSKNSQKCGKPPCLEMLWIRPFNLICSKLVFLLSPYSSSPPSFNKIGSVVFCVIQQTHTTTAKKTQPPWSQCLSSPAPASSGFPVCVLSVDTPNPKPQSCTCVYTITQWVGLSGCGSLKTALLIKASGFTSVVTVYVHLCVSVCVCL